MLQPPVISGAFLVLFINRPHELFLQASYTLLGENYPGSGKKLCKRDASDRGAQISSHCLAASINVLEAATKHII